MDLKVKKLSHHNQKIITNHQNLLHNYVILHLRVNFEILKGLINERETLSEDVCLCFVNDTRKRCLKHELMNGH
jgi:hypothetical protein